jgi:alcohol dehydrogenase class IV
VEDVDAAVAAGKQARCDLVVALGGGSVIDCGKAVAGMMTNPGSLVDYLEGVGKGLAIEVEPLPMIAVPTTAGTGSEVTKNAVITGPGYKKSVRSPKLIPDVALVDPDLTLSLPPHVTASCGMDALTQLVESYLSRNASPLTDGLCLEGLRVAGQALERVYHQPDDADAREQMALASLVGGICLANAGLGAVHGFASPLGALFPIPHGVACAALLPQVVRANLAAARGSQVEGRVCVRAARIGEAITGVRYSSNEEAAEAAVVRLEEIQRELAIPRLGTLGLEERDIPRLVAGSRGSSMRYNPVDLTDEQLDAALRSAW